MSKDLIYFRFNPDEWFNGDISLEDETTQGLFINICGYYWKKDCKLTSEQIQKRFIKNKARLKRGLNNLINNGIIKTNGNEYIIIEFLDEQYNALSDFKNKLSEAGRRGGKARLKGGLRVDEAININDKYNDKNNPLEGDPDSYLKKLLEIFKEEYKTNRGSEFTTLEPEKEIEGLRKILINYRGKKINQGKKCDEITNDFKELFVACLNISESWHYNNMAPSHICNKYNTVKQFIYGNNKKPGQSGKGTTDKQLADILSGKFDGAFDLQG